tara:strand:- start:1031 stop:1378 length:348 start_codon:yes stop_codon:yes gene_type:complete
MDKTVFLLSNRICCNLKIKNDRHLRRLVFFYLEERILGMGLSLEESQNYLEYLVYHDVASYVFNQGPPVGLSFKTITYCIMSFQKLYNNILEERYAPGGEGYLQAYKNFNSILKK